MFVFLIVMLFAVAARSYFSQGNQASTSHHHTYQAVNQHDDESPQYYQQSAH
jgi:uncharacterized protein (UPF0333 family)